MSKESEKDLLRTILETLEDIKSILLLANQDQIIASKRKLLKEGSIEEQVYELCDGVRTTQDIASMIKRTVENTGAVISSLRRKGLVKTVQRNGQKTHEQIL